MQAVLIGRSRTTEGEYRHSAVHPQRAPVRTSCLYSLSLASWICDMRAIVASGEVSHVLPHTIPGIESRSSWNARFLDTISASAASTCLCSAVRLSPERTGRTNSSKMRRNPNVGGSAGISKCDTTRWFSSERRRAGMNCRTASRCGGSLPVAFLACIAECTSIVPIPFGSMLSGTDRTNGADASANHRPERYQEHRMPRNVQSILSNPGLGSPLARRPPDSLWGSSPSESRDTGSGG